MPKLPRYTSKEIVAVLEKNGFVLKRQSGSHMIFFHPQGLRIIVSNHGDKNLHPKTIKEVFEKIEKSKLDS